MEYKLGKLRARKGAFQMKLGTYVDRNLVPVPLRIGHEKIGLPWGMFKNDEFSCCVFAGAAHEHMIWTHEGGKTVEFNDAGVLADYAAVTGFDPKNPDSDTGTDMEQAAQYRRKIGIIDAAGARHKIDAYLAPRIGDADDLALLCYLTGAVGVGLRLPNSAMDQFDAEKPWDVAQKTGGYAGGHYVTCLGRNTKGNFLVLTWGRIQAMTPRFYERFSDEAVGYFSTEILRGKVSPEGFDEPTLRSHIAKLGKPK